MGTWVHYSSVYGKIINKNSFFKNFSRFFLESTSHDYIMRIVPTIYEHIDGHQLYPFQFTFVHRVNSI